SALAAKFADGKLIVVNAFDVKEPKTKLFREALDNLKVASTALLVEEAKNGNRNLELSSRNLDGVELVRRNEVHPYHLLRYDCAIFTQPGKEEVESLVEELDSQRQRRGGEGAGGGGAKKAAAAPRRRTRDEKAAEVG